MTEGLTEVCASVFSMALSQTCWFRAVAIPFDLRMGGHPRSRITGIDGERGVVMSSCSW